MSGLHPEALLAAGYSLFLLATAAGIDVAARHSHRRSERYRTAGFTYHGHLDAWECPEGQHLHRSEIDQAQRLVRYRGKPQICNECPAKADCTDSDDGREVVRALDPWPHSEAGRFHRGISVALVCLAAVIATVALIRNHDPGDLLVLGAALGAVLIALPRMLSAFQRAPANFPGSPELR
jgi:Transposase DDE domain